MSLSKVNYIPKQTKITAENLNNIQDSIIDLESNTLQKVAKGSSEYKVDCSMTNLNNVRNLLISQGSSSDIGVVISPEGSAENPALAFYGKQADEMVTFTNVKMLGTLTINLGSTSIVYDGSSAKTVTIEDGTNISY